MTVTETESYCATATANLEKLRFGAQATRKRIGSFVFARIKLVFALDGFYTRIDLY